MIRFVTTTGHSASLHASPVLKGSEKTLGQSSAPSGKLGSVIGQEVGDRINAFLRQRYPTKTADSVAADTGIPAWTIAKWLNRYSLPNCLSVIALTFAYGPDFLASVMPHAPEWLDRAKRDERLRVLQIEIDVKRRELEALSR